MSRPLRAGAGAARRRTPNRAIRGLAGRPRRWLRRWTRTPLGRRVLRRRAGAWVLATAVAGSVGALVADAEADRTAWGRTVAVAVALRDLDAGELVTDAEVALRRWPAALVPRSAMPEVPVGRRLSSPVLAGEALVERRLARRGAGSAGARMGPGTAAVTVTLGAARPPLEVGDRVDVLALGPAAEVRTVARGAEVMELEEQHATLRVRSEEVDATAAAVLEGTLTLVLTG